MPPQKQVLLAEYICILIQECKDGKSVRLQEGGTNAELCLVNAKSSWI